MSFVIERLNSIVDFDRSLTKANVIFFVFAEWSGPSRQSRDVVIDAFGQLKRNSHHSMHLSSKSTSLNRVVISGTGLLAG